MHRHFPCFEPCPSLRVLLAPGHVAQDRSAVHAPKAGNWGVGVPHATGCRQNAFYGHTCLHFLGPGTHNSISILQRNKKGYETLLQIQRMSLLTSFVLQEITPVNPRRLICFRNPGLSWGCGTKTAAGEESRHRYCHDLDKMTSSPD